MAAAEHKEIVGVLHNIRSIHNVASIFRTADGAQVAKIYLCGITPTPLDRFKKVRTAFEKVSLGAEKTIPWEHNSSTKEILAKLKEENFYIVALEQAPKARLYTKSFSHKKIALIVGNEVEGIKKETLALADEVIEIPMYGKKESLNVSVAFGIAIYQIRTSKP